MIPNMTLEHLAHRSVNQIIESWFPVVSLIKKIFESELKRVDMIMAESGHKIDKS